MRKEVILVWIGRGQQVWYFVLDEMKAYKCKYAASGKSAPAFGEVKDVIEKDGEYYVPFRNKWKKVDVYKKEEWLINDDWDVEVIG